ncbi:MAG: TolC family protein [Oligoflexia bacterium]|nr:TolC family protein [Oligoflexia bacterium]
MVKKSGGDAYSNFLLRMALQKYLFIAVIISGNLFAQELSLEEAIQISMNENKEIQSSKYAKESSVYELKSSYGKLFPQLSLEGKYTQIDDPINLDIGSIRTAMIAADSKVFQTATSASTATTGAFRQALENAVPPFQMRVQDDHYYNLSATLLQPLFTGGKLSANIAAKKQEVIISERQDENTKDKVISDVVISYFRVQLMKELVVIRGDVVQGLRGHRDRAEKMLKVGILSQANKMRTDVALAEAVREEYKSQKDLELSYILLSNALGSDVKNFKLTTPLFVSEEKETLDSYLASSESENHVLQILAHKQEQLEEKGRAVASAFYPAFAAFAKYELYQNDLTLFEPDYALGVVMKFNLFNGASDYNDLQSVRAQKRTLAYYRENIVELVKTEIQKNYHDLKTAKEQLKSLESSRLLAEENLRLNKLSFAQGVATSLEVIDAELALSKVKIEQSKAMFDYDTSLQTLLRLSGNAKKIVESVSVSVKEKKL